MRGPYRVEWLEYYLQGEMPGVFLCSNDGEVVLKIGWSDKNLKEEIEKACVNARGLENKFSYFWFQTALTPQEAFSLYCRLWHKYRQNSPLSEHPEPPLELGDFMCPVPNCEWNENRRKLREDF